MRSNKQLRAPPSPRATLGLASLLRVGLAITSLAGCGGAGEGDPIARSDGDRLDGNSIDDEGLDTESEAITKAPGWYVLANVGDGLCLDGHGPRPFMGPCDATGANQHMFWSVSGSHLCNRASRLCLAGKVEVPGGNPVMRARQASPYQRWTSRLTSVPPIYHGHLRNNGTGACLDGFVTTGQHPYMFPCSDTNPFQTWTLIPIPL